MDIGTLVTVGGAVVGQVAHIVKKRTEEEKQPGVSEIDIFRKYVLGRPATTIGACVGAILAAIGLHTQGIDPVMAFLQAAVAGFAANSAINRPGEYPPPAEGQ